MKHLRRFNENMSDEEIMKTLLSLPLADRLDIIEKVLTAPSSEKEQVLASSIISKLKS